MDLVNYRLDIYVNNPSSIKRGCNSPQGFYRNSADVSHETFSQLNGGRYYEKVLNENHTRTRI